MKSERYEYNYDQQQAKQVNGNSQSFAIDEHKDVVKVEQPANESQQNNDSESEYDTIIRKSHIIAVPDTGYDIDTFAEKILQITVGGHDLHTLSKHMANAVDFMTKTHKTINDNGIESIHCNVFAQYLHIKTWAFNYCQTKPYVIVLYTVHSGCFYLPSMC